MNFFYTRVRFPPSPQTSRPTFMVGFVMADGATVGIESRRPTGRGGVARFFSRKILVTESGTPRFPPISLHTLRAGIEDPGPIILNFNLKLCEGCTESACLPVGR